MFLQMGSVKPMLGRSSVGCVPEWGPYRSSWKRWAPSHERAPGSFVPSCATWSAPSCNGCCGAARPHAARCMPELGTGSFTEERRIRATFAQRRNDDRYAWSTPAYVFMMQGIERQLLALLSRNDMSCLSGKRILEIGCGTGHWLREFVKWGAHPQDVVGMDLLADRVSETNALCAHRV